MSSATEVEACPAHAPFVGLGVFDSFVKLGGGGGELGLLAGSRLSKPAISVTRSANSVIVSTILIGWGLAATTPSQHLTGTVITTPQHLGRIYATLGETIPQLPRASQRWTRQRIRTALEVTLESIVFRSTDQPLTSIGIWTTDAARIFGPVLLALTLLAARNRVKR